MGSLTVTDFRSPCSPSSRFFRSVLIAQKMTTKIDADNSHTWANC